jgi:hypothetical protein
MSRVVVVCWSRKIARSLRHRAAGSETVGQAHSLLSVRRHVGKGYRELMRHSARHR